MDRVWEIFSHFGSAMSFQEDLWTKRKEIVFPNLIGRINADNHLAVSSY